MDAKEILTKAAEIIQRNGLSKLQYERAGACCAIGAIYKAATGNATPYTNGGIMGDPNPEIVKAGALLRKVIDRESISQWNDAIMRTKAEVVAALYEASLI